VDICTVVRVVAVETVDDPRPPELPFNVEMCVPGRTDVLQELPAAIEERMRVIFRVDFKVGQVPGHRSVFVFNAVHVDWIKSRVKYYWVSDYAKCLTYFHRSLLILLTSIYLVSMHLES
jgi:hypothetical protein